MPGTCVQRTALSAANTMRLRINCKYYCLVTWLIVLFVALQSRVRSETSYLCGISGYCRADSGSNLIFWSSQRSEQPYRSRLNEKSISAAIILLAPPRASASFGLSRFCLLKHALQSIDEYFNSIYGPYPILILVPNDDGGTYSRNDRVSLRSWAPRSTIEFVEIPLYSDLSSSIDFNVSQFQRWNEGLDGGVAGRHVGYRSMCRLWSGHLQAMPFLKRYDYYMRMDDDSVIIGPLPFDPFARMEEKVLGYAYRRQMTDTHGMKELWEFASPFMTTDSRMSMERMGMLSSGGLYEGLQPYNNFHVASVAIWNTPKWLRFLRVIDDNFGFFKYRFGDANMHAIAMGMLLNETELERWPDIPIMHNVNDLGDGYPPSGWKSECA